MAEFKELTNALKLSAWKTMLSHPRNEPMWPSSYDAADLVIFARVGGKPMHWDNRRFATYEGAALEKPIEKLRGKVNDAVAVNL